MATLTNGVRFLPLSVRRLPELGALARPASPYVRGWAKLYVDTVLQADRGCDQDFLVGSSGDAVSRESH